MAVYTEVKPYQKAPAPTTAESTKLWTDKELQKIYLVLKNYETILKELIAQKVDVP